MIELDRGRSQVWLALVQANRVTAVVACAIPSWVSSAR